MIPVAYTIVDPLAVVVKAVDAFVTLVAVPGALFKDSFTRGAKTVWVKLVDQLFKIQFLIGLYIARVHK